MRRRLFVCSAVVAVVGLLGAGLIYLRGGDDGDPDENVQIVVVDGQTYRIPLASTKIYQRDLRRFGGEAAVLFDDLSRSFAGLWRGRALALTIAWITALGSVGLSLLARQMPPDQRHHVEHGDRGG